MALTAEDLQALSALLEEAVEKQIQPVKEHLNKLDECLNQVNERLEQVDERLSLQLSENCNRRRCEHIPCCIVKILEVRDVMKYETI